MIFLPRHRFLTHFLLLITCLLLLVCVSEYFQGASIRADDPFTLSSKIEKLILKYGLTKSKIGIKIVLLPDTPADRLSGRGAPKAAPAGEKVIYEKNADVPLVPASNLKLFTTAAALCLLGPEFQYETKLYRLGAIRDGTLEGKLIVKSNGDPNISGRFYDGHTTAVFEKWGDALLRSGIKKIKGDIIIDDTAFDREYILSDWPADQLSYWYCAQISGVSFNDNCVDITIYPAAPMDEPRQGRDKKTGEIKYRLDPPTDYVTIVNNCKKVFDKSEHIIDFYRTPGTNTITIKGKFWAKAQPHKESVSIDGPGLWFGAVLKETLSRKKGIPVLGKIRLAERAYRVKEEQLVCLASVKTDLLVTIGVVNKRSQNFYAEQILKTLGYHFTGKGSYKTGLAQVRKFLTDEVKIPKNSFQLVDGSGLSRGNRISPRATINLLLYMYRHKYGKDFRESLAVSNEDKGVRKRLYENYKGRVFAKTGYLKGVSMLSGYFNPDPVQTGRQDKDYIFSITINNFSDRTLAEQFQCEVLEFLSGK